MQNFEKGEKLINSKLRLIHFVSSKTKGKISIEHTVYKKIYYKKKSTTSQHNTKKSSYDSLRLETGVFNSLY